MNSLESLGWHWKTSCSEAVIQNTVGSLISLSEAAESAPAAATAAEASQNALVKDFQRLCWSKTRLSLLFFSVCLLHRYLHPEGLPSDYTISMMLRLLPETPQEPFALWEILNKDNEPMVGLILDSESESLKVFQFSFFFPLVFLLSFK